MGFRTKSFGTGLDNNSFKLDWESIRSSPRDGFGVVGTLGFGFWGLGLHAEGGGLPHVLPLTVHLTILKLSYFMNFFVGPLLHA